MYYSRDDMANSVVNICEQLGFIACQCFTLDYNSLIFDIRDRYGKLIYNIKLDECSFNENELNKIYAELSKISKTYVDKSSEKQCGYYWKPISEYSRDKYDCVLIKYFDGFFECIPEVAEMRVDGKWYNRSGALIDSNVFNVQYFFDMKQLDNGDRK